MNTVPNYQEYTLEELQESYKQLDQSAYPEIAEKIKKEIASRLVDIESNAKARSNEATNNTGESYVTPKGNWFTLHWRGLLSLENSYWINVFAIGLILLYITPPLFQLLADSNASSELRGLAIIVFYIIITGISIWQLVGLYRSADKHPARGGTQGWAMIAKIMVFIGVTRYCFDMYQTGIPFMLASSKLAVGQSELPPITIRLMNNGTEIELQGGFEFGTAAQLSQVLSDNPQVQVIHLNSIGGRLVEANKLATIVKNKNLVTFTKVQCLSACPIVFLAGKEKLLGEGAKLGFHSASFGGVSGSELKELNNELLTQLEQANVAPWFVQKVSKVSADDMWTPTEEELIKARVIDKIVDSQDYAMSGVTDWQNPTTIDQELQKHEIYKSMNVFDKEGYAAVREKMVAFIQDGTPLNTIKTTINNYLYVERINHYMQLGGDNAVIEYMDAQIAQMEFLQEKYPAKCAFYTYPEVFDISIADDITRIVPATINEKETLALNSLIQSLSVDNYIVDATEQNELITQVINKMIAFDASYGDVLGTPTDYKNEPEKLCAVGIMLNKEINLLPKEKAGALLRSFFLTR